MSKEKLTIELVPSTCFFSNVRSHVKQSQWDVIRKGVYRAADHECEICGGKGKRHPVECHEVWDYDDKNKIQTLVRMIALCPTCHKVKHAGLAQIKGELDIVIKQLIKVNNMTKREAVDYLQESFEVWAERSNYKWKLDINHLSKFGIDVSSLQDGRPR